MSSSTVIALSLAFFSVALSAENTKVKEVVHIVGGSGIGKKTLIRRLLMPSETDLRQKLRIRDSVSAYGPVFIGSEAAFLDADTEQIINQWQFATDHWIPKARAAYPHAEHRIILLTRPLEAHTLGISARNGCTYSILQIQRERDLVDMRLQNHMVSESNPNGYEFVELFEVPESLFAEYP